MDKLAQMLDVEFLTKFLQNSSGRSMLSWNSDFVRLWSFLPLTEYVSLECHGSN